MSVRKWLAALLMVAMTMGLVGQVALAQTDGITVDEAVEFLQEFGIVQGDEGGLRLGDPITRAEMVKVLIVALGREREATILQGARAFSDTMDHWASGYIAVARNLSLAGGYPDGTFQPQNNVTNAEVIAFVTRAAGVQPDPTKQWPQNVLAPAAAAGIIPPGVDLTVAADSAATRGGVFLLAHRGFKVVTNDQGKNLYQRVFVPEPPSIQLSTTSTTTTAASVTVAGNVKGATSLTVGGRAVQPAANGDFSTSVTLTAGVNNIEVVARDRVGNVGTKTLTITRAAGEPARIDVPQALSIKAGDSAPVNAVVRDANGLEVANATLTAETSGDIGTFDVATKTFTAATKPGSGTLTLTAGSVQASVLVTVTAGDIAKVEVVADRESAAIGQQVQVTAKAYDVQGNEVKGYPVLYGIQGAGALINPSTGLFIGSQAGLYTVTATIGTTTGTTQVGVYGAFEGLKITGPAEIVGNEKGAAFRVAAVDRFGNAVLTQSNQVTLTTTVGTIVDAEDRTINSVTMKEGTATFYVKVSDAHWGVRGTITATDVEKADRKAELSFDVTEQRAAGIAIAQRDEYLAANDSDGEAEIKVRVVDQSGAPMLFGSWDLNYSISGPAVEKVSKERTGTLVYIASSGDAVLTLASRIGETGKVTVNLTAPSLASASTEVTARVVGAPSKLQLTFDKKEQVASDDASSGGTFIFVTATVTDNEGVPVKHTGDINIDFSSNYADAEGASGTVVTKLDTNADGNNDRIRVTYTDERRKDFRVAISKAGAVTVTAKSETGTSLTTATDKLTIKAGNAKTAGFPVTDSLIPVTSASGVATVKLYDDFDNPVPQAGVRVKFRANHANTTMNGSSGEPTFTTDDNGEVKIQYSVRPDTNANYNLEVISGGDVTPHGVKNTHNIKVASTVAHTIEVTFTIGGQEKARALGGELVQIRATVKDSYGGTLSGYENLLKLSVDDGHWSINDDGVGDAGSEVATDIGNWNSAGNYYWVEMYAAKAGRARVTVTADVGGQTVTGTTSIRIDAGAPYYATLAEADLSNPAQPKITVKKGTIKQFNLRLTDKYYNPVTSSDGTKKVVFNDVGTGAIFRQESTGADITTASLSSSISMYILVPSGGQSGEVRINDNGSAGQALQQWTVWIEAES